MTGAIGALRPLLQRYRRRALLGVGARLRQDDYAGMALADALLPLSDGQTFLVAEGGSAPENCTGVLRRFAPELVIVADAARMNRAPGEYALLDPDQITGATFCTHMLPLPVTLSYLEAACGCVTVYIGIQPACTEQGIGMDPAVEKGVQKLAEELSALFGGK